MKCDCGRQAEFVSNAEVYGRRYGKSYMIWLCRPCDARVGVHHNDPAKPLGTMAGPELRAARKEAHAAIDPYWRSGRLKRGHVYARLRDHFGRTVHIGESDKATCAEIVRVADDVLGADYMPKSESEVADDA